MSDLFASGSLGGIALGLAALGLSSTLHCASMCGGIVLLCCQAPGDRVHYQAGRLFGYLGMWSLLFVVGRNVFRGEAWVWAQAIAWFFVGVFIALQVLSVFGLYLTPSFSRMNRKLANFGARLRKRLPGPFFSGALSVLLPCGVLYAALLTALAVGHFYGGAFLVSVFWLFSVPGLVIGPALVRAFARHAGGRNAWARGALVLAVACFWFALRSDHSTVKSGEGEQSACHSPRANASR